MKLKSIVIAGVSALALGVAGVAPVSAQTFKFAFQADAQSLDPHSLFETFTIGLLANVYEPLVAYDGEMKKVPRLATSWEIVSPTKWRFSLRVSNSKTAMPSPLMMCCSPGSAWEQKALILNQLPVKSKTSQLLMISPLRLKHRYQTQFFSMI